MSWTSNHLGRSLISVLAVFFLCLSFGFVDHSSAAESFNKSYLSGTYVFFQYEQGAGLPDGSTAPPEAAMGILILDGKGNASGDIYLNGVLSPPDRLTITVGFTGTYDVDSKGFGDGTFTAQLQPGVSISYDFKFIIAKVEGNIATKMHMIVTEPDEVTGNLVVATAERRSGTTDTGCPWNPGDFYYCRDCGPCGVGEGNCRKGADCESGLQCSQDVGAQYGYGPKADVCESP